MEKKLIRSDTLRKQKIEKFTAMLLTLNEEIFKENLNLLGLNYYLKLFNTPSKPNFDINTINEILLTAFKERNWIYDYEENAVRDGYYKIIRKKFTKSLPNELL